MATLTWDAPKDRKIELGVSKGVLYPKGKAGVAWNGLTSVTEKMADGDISILHADNSQFAFLFAVEGFEATIEAYTYPVEFEECDGSYMLTQGIRIAQQRRRFFDLCYRTEIASSNGSENGYKLHLIYNAIAAPSQKSYKTVGVSPETSMFSWDVKCLPTKAYSHMASSIITIDSNEVDKIKIETLEKILYGTKNADPRMPTIEEVIDIIRNVDLEKIFVAALSLSGLWVWNTFNFKSDTVPIALEREARTRIHYNPSSGKTFPVPCVLYTLLSTDHKGNKRYTITVADTSNPSTYASYLEGKLILEKVGVTKTGDIYYHTYSLNI